MHYQEGIVQDEEVVALGGDGLIVMKTPWSLGFWHEEKKFLLFCKQNQKNIYYLSHIYSYGKKPKIKLEAT